MVIKNIDDRKIYGLTFIISFSSLLSAFMLEWFAGFDPCFLCWTQRFGFALVMIFSLLFFILNPAKKITKIIGYELISLSSIFGILVAVRHLYVIKNPESATCGVGPDMVFDMMPFFDALKQFFVGSSSCTKVEGILGLPFPIWALILFCSMFILTTIGSIKVLIDIKNRQ